MIKVCVIGGGSVLWAPRSLKDLLSVFDEPLDIRLHDIDPKGAGLVRRWCQIADEKLGRKDKIHVVSDRRRALKDADAVLITISTGGFDAAEQDVAIPERYDVFATVGDTTGPSGWIRSLRNIPVFVDIARDCAEVCPRAFVASYTNPMASLTAALEQNCPNPVVGLCHYTFAIADRLCALVGVEDKRRFAMTYAGMNHFVWVTDFRVDREDGYALFHKKFNSGRLAQLVKGVEDVDEIGMRSSSRMVADLYEATGYFTGFSDRHTSEFVPYALSGAVERRVTDEQRNGHPLERVGPYDIGRSHSEMRRNRRKALERDFADVIAGRKEMDLARSRETAADMFRAYLYNEPFVDAVNCVNRGQVPGLPEGVCLETPGVIDAMGVRPLVVSPIPEKLIEIMRPAAVCQKWITESGQTGDRDLALQALYRDPACSHLTPPKIREMADELLASNARWVHPKLLPSD